MRVESSVTSVSWIPSEAIRGITKLPFELKVGHYDSAPPEHIEPEGLPSLRDADRFRFANHLSAWIEVEDGRDRRPRPGRRRRPEQHAHARRTDGLHVPGPRVPRPPTSAGGERRLCGVHADRGRAARHARASARGARTARRSSPRPSGRRCGSSSTPTVESRERWSGPRPSRATGCTTTRATWSPRAPPSRSRTGTSGARARRPRRGATRTRRCSRRWPRRPSSASSPPP